MASILRPRTGPWTSQPAKSSIAWSTHNQNAAQSFNILQAGSAPVGLYEVSLFLALNTAGTTGTLRMQVDCTGAVGSTIYALPDHDIQVTGTESGIFLVDSNGADAMTLSFIFTSVTVGSLQYSYRAVVNMIDNQS